MMRRYSSGSCAASPVPGRPGSGHGTGLSTGRLCEIMLSEMLSRRAPLSRQAIVVTLLAEAWLRSSLMMAAGSIEPMFARPLPVLFLLIALALLAWSPYDDWKRSRGRRHDRMKSAAKRLRKRHARMLTEA